MRGAFILSGVLHASIILAALVSLPSLDTPSTPAINALPVELVTIEDETDLTVGQPDEEAVVEDAAPETVTQAEAPAEPETQPGAGEAPAERIATEEDAVDTSAVSAAPEPSAPPAPPEPEPVPEPEPAETPPETDVAALPEPDPEPTPPEPAAEPVRTPATVVPQPRPTPPRRPEPPARVEREAVEEFDADRISQLLNRTDPTGGGRGTATASLGAEAGRANAALTLSEQDALRAQMQRCWNPPIGVRGSGDLVVTIQLRLAPDGRVEEIVEIGAQGIGALYDVAADAARRAVLQCQPYTLPPQKYEAWKEVRVNFDPRELF